jgi:hypothetical protein
LDISQLCRIGYFCIRPIKPGQEEPTHYTKGNGAELMTIVRVHFAIACTLRPKWN